MSNSSQKPEISLEISIAETMKKWPETIQVFLDHRMICIGCHMSVFDTLDDAIANYGLSADDFLQLLNDIISSEDVLQNENND